MRCPVTRGMRIVLLTDDGDINAKVTQVLATQFTCRTKRGATERFRFFKDKGVTWSPAL